MIILLSKWTGLTFSLLFLVESFRAFFLPVDYFLIVALSVGWVWATILFCKKSGLQFCLRSGDPPTRGCGIKFRQLSCFGRFLALDKILRVIFAFGRGIFGGVTLTFFNIETCDEGALLEFDLLVFRIFDFELD